MCRTKSALLLPHPCTKSLLYASTVPRHPSNPLGLPTEHERRARADELDWLFEMDAPRKPRKSRDGLPSYDTPQWRAAFGIPPDEDDPPPE